MAPGALAGYPPPMRIILGGLTTWLCVTGGAIVCVWSFRLLWVIATRKPLSVKPGESYVPSAPGRIVMLLLGSGMFLAGVILIVGGLR